MYIDEFKWSDGFGDWWFKEIKKDNLLCPITMNNSMNNLPSYYYSNLMEFASYCFEAGRASTIHERSQDNESD